MTIPDGIAEPTSESIEGKLKKFWALNVLEALAKIKEVYAAQLDRWRSRYKPGPVVNWAGL